MTMILIKTCKWCQRIKDNRNKSNSLYEWTLLIINTCNKSFRNTVTKRFYSGKFENYPKTKN